MWQTFTPDKPNLTSVEIDILTANPGQGGDSLTVEIAEDGQVLVSVDRYVEDGFDGLLRFEFAQAVAVVPGEIYELKVRDTGKTRFGWKYASNTYDTGSRYVFANERPGTDWFFQTYAMAGPRIIYVDDDAAGTNDGSNWENAYNFLQDALADANSAEKPVEIRIAQGIYKPDMGANQTAGDREATFQLINGVSIYGGFPPVDDELGHRDPNLYETILSGDLYGDDAHVDDPCDLPNEPTRADNSFRIVTANGVDNTTILDGFTITGGNADGPEYLNFYSGGGMFNQDSNPTLINCTFNGNASGSGGGMYNQNGNPTLTDCTFNGNASYYGGGMYNQNGNPTLTDCTFDGNASYYSGGMYNQNGNPNLTNCTFNGNSSWFGCGGGMYNQNGNPNLTNCTFNRNSSWFSGGGGIFNSSNSSPILTNCIFSANHAGYGGGMENSHSSNPAFTNCTFRQNSAEFAGGGMENGMYSSPTLANCTFSGNLAQYGGGMENYENSSPTLTNCTFSQNSAGNYGGGMVNMIDSNPIMTNCIFSQNMSEDDGGGVCNLASSPVLINCTFAQNSAENGNAIGSGIVYDYYRIDPNNMELINCILWDGGNEIWNEYGSPTIITYCNIQGGKASIFDPHETVIWGEGNIDVDPLFADPGYWANVNDPNIIVEPNDPNAVWIEGDYHLKSQAGRFDPNSGSWVIDDVTSPCIDAGDPNSPVGDEPFPNGGIINMGAYGGTAEASKSYTSELLRTAQRLIRAYSFKSG
jgi:hypothetical protein